MNKRPNGYRMMPVTISQIARELGISRHAVSHVLNGREHKVSAETQKRIRDAVANMDYQRNRLVDVFRSQRTRIIGVII